MLQEGFVCAEENIKERPPYSPRYILCLCWGKLTYASCVTYLHIKRWLGMKSLTGSNHRGSWSSVVPPATSQQLCCVECISVVPCLCTLSLFLNTCVCIPPTSVSCSHPPMHVGGQTLQGNTSPAEAALGLCIHPPYPLPWKTMQNFPSLCSQHALHAEVPPG